MKYIVSYDDGLFGHSCVVDVPKGTDEFTMLEIATELYDLCWDWFRSEEDYLNWAHKGDPPGYTFSEEEIKDMWENFWWSSRLGKYLCV